MEVFNKYLDLLELPPEAALEDVRRNYRYLKSLYSGDSIVIRALNDDFSQELRVDYLSRLDQAYEQLIEWLEKKKAPVITPTTEMDEELRVWIETIACFNGAALRSIRERMHVELKTIFAATRIQIQYLEDMENEAFDSFRAEVYLRSYLIEYTRFLSLDSQRVLNDYLPRYRAWSASGK